MICPKCKQPGAHRSHRKGFWDRVASLIGRRPYRCTDCQHRFRATREEDSAEGHTRVEREIVQTRRRIRMIRWKRELLIYGMGAVAFLIVLRLILQQRFWGD